jgi:beta-lactamase class C
MPDIQSFASTVSQYIQPLIAGSSPEPDKSVGILVGLTFVGARAYYSFGSVGLHSGSGVQPENIVSFIGSNTKVFTATLLALADFEKTAIPISGNTAVADLLPSCATIHYYENDPDYVIKLWHLATHSSGFPEGVCGKHTFGNYPFTAMQTFLEAFHPKYGPNEYWVYSNQAYALLGALLSHAYTGGTSSTWDSTYWAWPGLITKYITPRLNMPATQVDYSGVASQVAQGYAYQVGQSTYQSVDPPTWGMDSAGLAAGAMSSTLTDMLTFLVNQIAPPPGWLGEAIAQTQQPHGDNLSMGLGWQIGNGYFDKNGGLAGYESYMAFDPTSTWGLVLLGNTSGGTAGGALTTAGRKLLGALREQTADRSDFPAPPHCKTPTCP